MIHSPVIGPSSHEHSKNFIRNEQPKTGRVAWSDGWAWSFFWVQIKTHECKRYLCTCLFDFAPGPLSLKIKLHVTCSLCSYFFNSFVSTFVYKNCYYACSMRSIIFAHIAVFKLCFQLTEQQQQNVEVIDVLLCLFLMLLLWSHSVRLVCVVTVCASLLRPVEPDQIFLQVCVFWTFVLVCCFYHCVWVDLIWLNWRQKWSTIVTRVLNCA